ncbi:MAG: replication initiation protein [Clostridium butyricum]
MTKQTDEDLVCNETIEEYEQLSMIKQLNNTSYTYKSSELILSSYDLSVTQQRIINLGCKKIQPIYIEKRMTPDSLKNVLGAISFDLIKISTSEFKKEYGLKGNNIYDSLEQEIDDLYQKEIRYLKNKDGRNKEGKKRWVDTLEFDRPNGTIDMSFNPSLILDLLVLKGQYVALFFDMSQSIGSKYAFRLYEILKNFAYLGNYKVLVEELKYMLNIVDKYVQFRDFSRGVLKPNLEAINKYSDIQVEYTLIRAGRNVKWIDFKISMKRNKSFTPNNNFKEQIPTAFNEVSEALAKYNITLSSSDAEMLFDLAIEVTKVQYPNMSAVDYIMEKVKILDNYVQTKDVESAIGFIRRAMETDYGNKSIKKIGKPTNFNNFEGRNYTKEESKKMEYQLLGWDTEIETEEE